MAQSARPPWIAPTMFFVALAAIVGFFMFTQDDQPHFQATPTPATAHPSDAWSRLDATLAGHWGSSDRRAATLEVDALEGNSASFLVVLESGERLDVEGTLRGATFHGRVHAPDTPWDDAVVELTVGDRRCRGRVRLGNVDEEISFALQ